VRGLEAGASIMYEAHCIEEMLRGFGSLANARLTQSARAALDVSGRYLLRLTGKARSCGDAAGAEIIVG